MVSDFDPDLVSIQEARTLVRSAKRAQVAWATATQADVDRVCSAMAQAGAAAAAELADLAVRETGYGIVEHKILKNELATTALWNSVRDVKTAGVVAEDGQRGTISIAMPMGVIAALVPSTNPTSTALFKSIIAVKARNAIVVSPHPSAAKCTGRAVDIVAQAAMKAGAPQGLVSCMRSVSLQGTDALLRDRSVALILATGGTPMVRAAHSVGKPAYGVGPGNVPCYIDRSADLEQAAQLLVASKAFDNSVICATEQAAVVDRAIAGRFAQLVQTHGAYFVSAPEADALRALLFYPDGSINTKTVGQSATVLAAMAGFDVPSGTRVLVARLATVGKAEPLSREKLTTVLGWYEVDDWKAGCDRCLELIHFGGDGHSVAIHARDRDVVLAFGLEKPVHRIVVNTMSTLGATGGTTGLDPSMTLGPGGIGGAITGDNIGVRHLFTVKRVAWGIKPPPAQALLPGTDAKALGRGLSAPVDFAARQTGPVATEPAVTASGTSGTGVTPAEIERIAQRVLADLRGRT